MSKDIKDEILAEVKHGSAVMELSKQYGVHFKTMNSWLRTTAVGNVSTIEHSKPQRENVALKEIIGRLSLELTKFKKSRSHKACC